MDVWNVAACLDKMAEAASASGLWLPVVAVIGCPYVFAVILRLLRPGRPPDRPSTSPSSATYPITRPPLHIFPQLPPELNGEVLRHVSQNDVVCNVRLLNKSAAAHFRDLRVRPSQPAPPDAFRRRWGRPDDYHSLNLSQRRQLLSWTAATGVISNLEVAVDNAGCLLTVAVFDSAAAAGQVESCRWLQLRGCPTSDSERPHSALIAAARGGHQAMCVWLLPNGWRWCKDAVLAAGCGGHVALMEWLLRQRSPTEEEVDQMCLLIAVAEGCDLTCLQHFARQHPPQQATEMVWGRVLVAAAGSSTPDWQAKVVWLIAEFGPFPTVNMYGARPGLSERLGWLRSVGLMIGPLSELGNWGTLLAWVAIRDGSVAVLEVLLAEGVQPFDRNALLAAEHGHLAVMQLLHERGLLTNLYLPHALALKHGQLHIVQWLTPLCSRDAMERVKFFAFGSGSMPLLTWLDERYGPPGHVSGTDMASSGCVAAVGWMAGRMRSRWAEDWRRRLVFNEKAYLAAASNGDLLMLCYLRHRLRLPWGSGGSLFTAAVREGCALPVLQWLAEEGYHVEWDQAVREAAWRERIAGGAGVKQWLREGQQRHLEEQRQQRSAP